MIYDLLPTLAEAGKIKIGGLGETREKRGGGSYRLPVKYDHFVITTSNERTPEGDLIPDEILMAALDRDENDKLTRIPIYLHSDEIEEVFPSAYACYAGKKLHCRGNGREAMRWEIRDGRRTGESKEVACKCNYLIPYEDRDAADKKLPICRPHAVLHCSIAAPGHAVAGAVYRFRTTSIITIQRMIGSLRQIIQTVGCLQGLPLVLCLEPVAIPDRRSTVYCTHIELHAADIEAAQRRALASAQMRKQIGVSDDYRDLISLPAADDETDEEQAAVQEEWHPPAEAGEVQAQTGSGNEKLRGALG
jgi:hypothetical protein